MRYLAAPWWISKVMEDGLETCATAKSTFRIVPRGVVLWDRKYCYNGVHLWLYGIFLEVVARKKNGSPFMREWMNGLIYPMKYTGCKVRVSRWVACSMPSRQQGPVHKSSHFKAPIFSHDKDASCLSGTQASFPIWTAFQLVLDTSFKCDQYRLKEAKQFLKGDC